MNYALQFDRDMRAQRQEQRQREVYKRMRMEGSHLLSGHVYWPSEKGSRVLAPIIARLKAREAA